MARPLLQWASHRSAGAHREFLFYESAFTGEESDTLLTYSHDQGTVDAYRYRTREEDGLAVGIAPCQSLDPLRDINLAGAAIGFSTLNEFALYRLSGRGTVWASEYSLAPDGDEDRGAGGGAEPCPSTCGENPSPSLARSNLKHYTLVDFNPALEAIAKDEVDHRPNETPIASNAVVEFMSTHESSIAEQLSQWWCLSELYAFLRRELHMPPVGSSLEFYDAVQSAAVLIPLTLRRVPGVSVSPHSLIPIPLLQGGCSCTLSEDCIPSAECTTPNACMSLERNAVCANDRMLTLDLSSTWQHAKEARLSAQQNDNARKQDFSNDIDTMMAFLTADNADNAASIIDDPVVNNNESRIGTETILASLVESWNDLLQNT
uniref:Uncharacterized protein n=3 Tax=Spongospora subterranea TaxID=70186 RepID=A0A0H5QFM3_9EUKA|eukprot:CRZ00755.1 hypothetical protein [Spongospora subterranea]